ncbi:ATP-binding cassette domain-containing protein [Nocardia sp. NPDC052112]|uniref:ATP-binding cassette domain-containing protein n=1 Tax=Nocardia sp. NPDC052112 TaxID=3155646 RepID=UPI003424B82E
MGVIEATALTKCYGRTLALDRLDLDIPRGEIYGFLGPNGAGKTTTIRVLLGLHRPAAGTVRIAGLDAWSDPVAAHRHCAYVACEPTLDALGTALKAPNWSLQLSPFHALARVPMQHFALTPALWITAIGLGSFGAALFAFRRRDLAMG